MLGWTGFYWQSEGGKIEESGLVQSSFYGGCSQIMAGYHNDVHIDFSATKNGYHFENPSTQLHPNGICVGMSFTVAWSVFSGSPPDAGNFLELPLGWQNWIEETQTNYGSAATLNHIHLYDDLSIIHSELLSGRPVAVGIVGAGGHGIVGYDFKYDSQLPGIRVKVYDPNFPMDDDRELIFLKSGWDGSWTMQPYASGHLYLMEFMLAGSLILVGPRPNRTI